MRKRRFFDDDIDRMFEEMRRMMERIAESINEDFEEFAKDPNAKVYGFSMRIGPDGKPIIREFGNVRPALESGRWDIGREPLIDVFDEGEHITIIAEMPGVNKEDVSVKCLPRKVILKSVNPEHKYYKEISLPVEVIPESGKASFKNGVITIKLNKKHKPKMSEGVDIKVE